MLCWGQKLKNKMLIAFVLIVIIAITASVQVKAYTVYQTFMNICVLKNELFMNFLC